MTVDLKKTISQNVLRKDLQKRNKRRSNVSFSEDSRVISRDLVLLQGSEKLDIQNNILDILIY